MAAVDTIRGFYRDYLGRDASDEEAQNWASGAYGHGDANNLDAVRNAIAGSDEARQRGAQPPQVLGPREGENRGYETQQPSGIDPTFLSQISGAYDSYLGRSASQDELSNWWSGAFGYGSGMSGMDAIKEAIRTSGEARTRNSGNAPTPNYLDVGYWQQQGVTPDQIFDLNTGQTRAGWQRTGHGYERTTGTTSVGGPNGDFEGWFRQLTNGKPITPQTLTSLGPILEQNGIRLGPPNARGFIDTIILPDGAVIDVIEGATPTGGVRWQFLRPGPGGSNQPSVNMPGNQYSDAYTAMLEMLMKNRIGALQQPVNDPNRAMYEQMLKQRAQQLSTGNAQLDQLLGYLQKRFTELQGPGYTGAENEVIRTGALDPIEQDRKAARDRVMQRLSQRGINPNSGIAQQALLEIDKQFDALRGTTQTQLAGNELARRENRAQRAEAIGGQIADIPELRAREQLDVFEALARLSQLARGEEDARSREAISYGGALSDLGPQRLQLAMQAAGMGGNPSSLGSMLTQVAGLNQNAQAFNSQNSNSLWSGLGSIAAILARQGQWGLGG